MPATLLRKESMSDLYNQAYLESTLLSLRSAISDLGNWNMDQNGGEKRNAIDAGVAVLRSTYQILEIAIRCVHCNTIFTNDDTAVRHYLKEHKD
jgi:hypothetical protein